jgi:hypothetical protein
VVSDQAERGVDRPAADLAGGLHAATLSAVLSRTLNFLLMIYFQLNPFIGETGTGGNLSARVSSSVAGSM